MRWNLAISSPSNRSTKARASSAERKPAMDPRISDLLAWLQNEYREPVRIPELAKRCCLSPSRLSHLFRQQVGDTILGTVLKIRLEKAAELLAFTARQVAEIAEDVGFGCTDHFTRMFCKTYGKTPTEYRKAKQQAAEQAIPACAKFKRSGSMRATRGSTG